MLTKECESRLGQPPCNYAIIALGSVARMEATPFSDLEFAILYADPAIGDKINYFRVLSHFLHLKVINLGETILPALAIEQLNDFQCSDPSGNWFYDSETPRGISFDGAMPWASKTALGRMKTKSKPALELIRTPEEMAEFQDEEIAVKEGYHLGKITLSIILHLPYLITRSLKLQFAVGSFTCFKSIFVDIFGLPFLSLIFSWGMVKVC